MATIPAKHAKPRTSDWTPRERRRLLIGLLFFSPWIVHFIAFQLYPFVASLYFSFTTYSVLQPPNYIGLSNYVEMVSDRLFWTSLYNTVYYLVLYLSLSTVIAIGLALLLNMKVKAMAVYRTIFYVPSVTPLVALSVVWIWLFNSQYGLMNAGFRAVGLPTIGWLSDPAWSKNALVLMGLWGVGSAVVIYLAGLQDIPQELYDAAAIDGANRRSTMWNITLPLLSPVILFNVITGMIGAFQYFTQALIVSGGSGGPADSTLMYALYLYLNAFQFFRMGFASALAWVLFVIVMLCTLLVFRVSSRRVYYGGK